MATKKKGKASATKKASGSKKVKRGSSSNAPYILVIMALAAGLIFLLSLQSDSLKNFFGKKNNLTSIAKVEVPPDDRKLEKKDSNATMNKAGDTIKEKPHTQQLSPKEKEKAVTVSAKVYFLYYNEKTDHIELMPVVRTVSALTPVKNALEELAKGPTANEEKKGLVNAVPSTLKVIDVSIINNIAFINFNSALEEGAAGNILMNRLDQIVYTATQFDNVEGIHILVNGQRKRFLGSDGISVTGPLRRH